MAKISPTSDDKHALKLKYNELLAKFIKAEAYIDNEDIPLADREKYAPEFARLGQELYEVFKQTGEPEDKFLKRSI